MCCWYFDSKRTECRNEFIWTKIDVIGLVLYYLYIIAHVNYSWIVIIGHEGVQAEETYSNVSSLVALDKQSKSFPVQSDASIYCYDALFLSALTQSPFTATQLIGLYDEG